MANNVEALAADIKTGDHYIICCLSVKVDWRIWGLSHPTGWDVSVYDNREDKYEKILNVYVYDLDIGKKLAQEVVETLVDAPVNLVWRAL